MLSDEVHNQLPIEGDHSTIVKFKNPSDLGYKTVARRLKCMVEKATTMVNRKFRPSLAFSTVTELTA